MRYNQLYDVFNCDWRDLHDAYITPSVEKQNAYKQLVDKAHHLRATEHGIIHCNYQSFTFATIYPVGVSDDGCSDYQLKYNTKQNEYRVLLDTPLPNNTNIKTYYEYVIMCCDAIRKHRFDKHYAVLLTENPEYLLVTKDGVPVVKVHQTDIEEELKYYDKQNI